MCIHPKMERPPIPKIVHLWHFAIACGEMEQSELQTLMIRLAYVCVFVCVFMCVCALSLNNDQKKEIRWEDLGTKGRHIARLDQWHGYESYGEIKDYDTSWVLIKEAIKYGFLSVPLRLNTCLHWTIWPILRGVQCKLVSLFVFTGDIKLVRV
jgi:hypothetical protein